LRYANAEPLASTQELRSVGGTGGVNGSAPPLTTTVCAWTEPKFRCGYEYSRAEALSLRS